MLGTIVGPVLLSFDKRVSFYKKWKFLPIPLFITLLYFVIWDSYFTKIGIWNFNDNYIIGKKMVALPIEEWLFFIFVPFACIFIYECTNFYIKKDILQNYAYKINGIILLIISIVAILFQLPF